jgi:CBS domain-containing protein
MPYQEPIDTIMTESVQSVTPDQSAEEAQWVMLEYGIHHLPVTKEGRLVGIITTTDILRHRVEKGDDLEAPVGDIMQTDVVILGQDATLGEAARVLATGEIHSAPVVDDDQNLVGIVTSTDLIDYLRQQAG